MPYPLLGNKTSTDTLKLELSRSKGRSLDCTEQAPFYALVRGWLYEKVSCKCLNFENEKKLFLLEETWIQQQVKKALGGIMRWQSIYWRA